MGEELPRLALKLQPLAQGAPFGAIGILDEHRQDARQGSRQPQRGDRGKALADRHGNLVGAGSAGGQHEDPAVGLGHREVCLGAKLGAQRAQQSLFSGEALTQLGAKLGTGQHQRIQPQHGRGVLIGAHSRLQHGADAAVQLRQSRLVGAQPLRQGQLQQILPGMGREPGLQVGIDKVDQIDPGAAMHVPPLLGGDRIACNLRRHALAGDQQVMRGAIVQSAVAHGETARSLQCGDAEQVKQRRHRRRAGQRGGQALLQAKLAVRSKPRTRGGDLLRHAGDQAFGPVGRHSASRLPVERRFNGMTLRQGTAATLAGAGALGQLGHPATPSLGPAQPDESGRGAGQRRG